MGSILSVRQEVDVIRLIDQTTRRFGRLDVAVNNAGTEGRPGPVTEFTAENYAAMFDTNVLGTLLGMKHGTASTRQVPRPLMNARRSGSTTSA
jgi:NAD(P)-dependent dehydrogenase (short-subunit alcohol dehydrogenase family)